MQLKESTSLSYIITRQIKNASLQVALWLVLPTLAKAVKSI